MSDVGQMKVLALELADALGKIGYPTKEKDVLKHIELEHNTIMAAFAKVKALSSPPEARHNTEQDTFLGALITEYGNCSFDAGAWDGDGDDDSYSKLNDKVYEAKSRLIGEISRRLACVPSPQVHKEKP